VTSLSAVSVDLHLSSAALAMRLLALVLALVLLPAFVLGTQQKDAEPESELAQLMEKLEDQLKPLRKSLREGGSPIEARAALVEIQRLTLACKELEPAAAAKLPEAERAAFVTAYRRTMVDFLLRQLELEAALLDGDAVATQAAFDRFREMEDSAHERFAPEDE
jgi:hypothetical protein